MEWGGAGPGSARIPWLSSGGRGAGRGRPGLGGSPAALRRVEACRRSQGRSETAHPGQLTCAMGSGEVGRQARRLRFAVPRHRARQLHPECISVSQLGDGTGPIWPGVVALVSLSTQRPARHTRRQAPEAQSGSLGLLTVTREIPSSLAVARIESPCSCACWIAFERASCRGVGARSCWLALPHGGSFPGAPGPIAFVRACRPRGVRRFPVGHVPRLLADPSASIGGVAHRRARAGRALGVGPSVTNSLPYW